LGHALYYGLQAGTLLILVLAANTSFADFPRLASFHAGDNFMPRQLTKRGHRLVFSNGILFLAATSVALLIVTGAKVDRLIPLYAIGVFTSFTLSQAGMARHHITNKEQGWRFGLFVNGMGAVLSLVVDVIVAVTKFKHGAWVIIVLVPVMVAFLVRLARQYEHEARHLECDVPASMAAPPMHRLVVLVFLDRLDLAAVQAVKFGRTLKPDELRAVHFVIDPQRAEELAEAWQHYGLTNVGLELVDCPDRRLPRAAVKRVAQTMADGQTGVCVVLPDRRYNGVWRRILHDETADAIAREVSRLPNANVTLVPFHLGDEDRPATIDLVPPAPSSSHDSQEQEQDEAAPVDNNGAVGPADPDHFLARSIADVRWRERVRVTGRVNALRVTPGIGGSTLECTLADNDATLSVLFLGRRRIPGVEVGASLTVEGMTIDHHGRLAIINPSYDLTATTAAADPSASAMH